MRKDRLLRKLLMDRFVVTLASGESFDGLLVDLDEKTVHLADAVALDGRNRVKVDGTLYLPRAGISYLQRPGTPL
jgi:small nuclear ribonucleoprotein (snRNP)-like protein